MEGLKSEHHTFVISFVKQKRTLVDSFEGHPLLIICLWSALWRWTWSLPRSGPRLRWYMVSGQEGQKSWRRLRGDWGLRIVCCPSPATAEDLVTPPASVTTSYLLSLLKRSKDSEAGFEQAISAYGFECSPLPVNIFGGTNKVMRYRREGNNRK